MSIQVDYDQQFDKYVAIFVKFDCFCNKFIDVQRGRLPVSLCVRDHMWRNIWLDFDDNFQRYFVD